MCKYPRHPKTVAVIRRAREIIADPTQRHLAVLRDARRVHYPCAWVHDAGVSATRESVVQESSEAVVRAGTAPVIESR